MGEGYYWSLKVRRKGFNPTQPRVPAGSSGGGQWASSGGTSVPQYMEPFERWPIHENTFAAGANAFNIREWLRSNAPDGRVYVDERTGELFIKLANRLREGRLMAAVSSLSGGPGYEVNMTEFKR